MNKAATFAPGTGQEKQLLLLLLLITALGPASTQVFLPTLPLIQAEFNVSPGVSQLGLSLPMLAMAFSDLAYGPWSDRIGRRPVLIFGLVTFLCGCLLCLFTQNIVVLIIGRILQDCGGAVGIVLSRAIALDIYGHKKAAGIIALTLMAMTVGPMFGPLIGGSLSDYYGWRSIFLFMLCIGIFIIFLAIFKFHETHLKSTKDATLRDVKEWFKRLLLSPSFNAYAWHSAFVWGIFMAFIGATPYIMNQILQRPSIEFGLWLIPCAMGYVAGNLLSARWSQTKIPDSMVRLGSSLILVGIILLASMIFLHYWIPAAIFLPTTIIALGAGLTIPNAQAMAVDAIPELSGSASGVIGFLMMIIGAFAVQSVGMLQNDTPYPMISIMSILAIGSHFVLRLRPRPTAIEK